MKNAWGRRVGLIRDVVLLTVLAFGLATAFALGLERFVLEPVAAYTESHEIAPGGCQQDSEVSQLQEAEGVPFVQASALRAVLGGGDPGAGRGSASQAAYIEASGPGFRSGKPAITVFHVPRLRNQDRARGASRVRREWQSPLRIGFRTSATARSRNALWRGHRLEVWPDGISHGSRRLVFTGMRTGQTLRCPALSKGFDTLKVLMPVGLSSCSPGKLLL